MAESSKQEIQLQILQEDHETANQLAAANNAKNMTVVGEVMELPPSSNTVTHSRHGMQSTASFQYQEAANQIAAENLTVVGEVTEVSPSSNTIMHSKLGIPSTAGFHSPVSADKIIYVTGPLFKQIKLQSGDNKVQQSTGTVL